MTVKQKDLKVASPQWVAAWKKNLADDFAMRCMLEPNPNYLRFWMELFLMDGANGIYQIRFERFLGDTIAPPRVLATKYDGPLEAFLDDLENFWTGQGNYLVIDSLALAIPHRAFIRPLGSDKVVLLPTNHPVLMANYGAVREWAYQARRGRVRISDGTSEVRYSNTEEVVWQMFERRFRMFLYRQQLSIIRDTVGEVVPARG